MGKHTHLGNEHPQGHLIHASSPIIFMIILILDIMFNPLTIALNELLPDIFQYIAFAGFLVLALFLIKKAHDTIFKEVMDEPKLLTEGILGFTRNPMYLGVLLIYPSFIILSGSILGQLFWFCIIYAYNKIVDYEDNVIEEKFGEEYREYKKKVPKWLPFIPSIKK
jgi:protein-S-isoprenylcysteine O-methyltransferase Ste14